MKEDKIIYDPVMYDGKEVIKGFSVDKDIRAIDILNGFLNPPEDGIVTVSQTYIGLCNKEQSQKWHPEGDVMNHIYNGLMFLEHTPMLYGVPFQAKRLLEGIWIYHDIGKVQYPGPKYIGHDKAGLRVLDEIPDSEFDDMIFHENKKDIVETFVHYHMRKEVKDRKKIQHIVEAVKDGLMVKVSWEGNNYTVNGLYVYKVLMAADDLNFEVPEWLRNIE